MPEDPQAWKDWYDGLTHKEKEEINGLLRGVPKVSPNRGPQTMAYRSQAAFTGFGGSAGGGKSSLIALLVLFGHTRCVIFRHDADEAADLIRLIRDWYGSDIGLNKQDKMFRFGDKHDHFVEWGGLGKPESEFRWQGRAHDLLCFDEMQFLTKAKIKYVSTWARTTLKHQRVRKLGTFNPPGNGADDMDVTGDWILDFFAPWIHEDYPFPATDGEVRYFMPLDDPDDPDREKEMQNGEPELRILGGREVPVLPEARTFIQSHVWDNPFFLEEGNTYIDDLFQLPYELRQRMLYGSFKSGLKDQPYQMIPGSWVDAAMKRWIPAGRHQPMSSLGLDVAQGVAGKSFSCFTRRHWWWWDKIHKVPGNQTTLGSDAAEIAFRENKEGATYCVDANGTGSAAYEAIKNRVETTGVQVIPIKGQEQKTAIFFKLQKISNVSKFANVRTALYWCLRKILDPDNGLEAALPDNKRLRKQLITPTYSMRGSTLVMEPKDVLEKRLGYSPDEADSVVSTLANVFDTPGFPNILPKGRRPNAPMTYQQEFEQMRAQQYLAKHGDFRGFPMRGDAWMGN